MQSDLASMVWPQCQSQLQTEMPEQQFNTWIRPLVVQPGFEGHVQLVAPNRFIEDWVKNKFLSRIEELMLQLGGSQVIVDITVVGSPVSEYQTHNVNQVFAHVGDASEDAQARKPNPKVVLSKQTDMSDKPITSAAEISLKTN